MNEEIDCEFTDNLVCPYCGNVEEDSWENGFDLDGDELTCNSCGKEYLATVHVSYDYTTEKKDKK